MSVDWEDLKTILYVVREGRLTRAAAALGINYTTVARRIARAEARLNMRLFERLKDGYHPTAIAKLVAEHVSRMEMEEHGLMRALSRKDDTLSGPLVITAPQLLIQTHIVHVIDVFCTAYPEVELEVNAANDLLDLTRRQADLAIRISNNPGDDLKGLRLTTQHTASFASPALARQINDTPGDPIDWIIYTNAAGLPRKIDKRYPRSRIKARFDDMVSMIGAAQAGLGVVRMPVFLGRATAGLEQVPLLPPQPYADIWVVAHRDVWPSARVRAFRDCLVSYFRQHRACFTA